MKKVSLARTEATLPGRRYKLNGTYVLETHRCRYCKSYNIHVGDWVRTRELSKQNHLYEHVQRHHRSLRRMGQTRFWNDNRIYHQETLCVQVFKHASKRDIDIKERETWNALQKSEPQNNFMLVNMVLVCKRLCRFSQ